MAEFLIRAKNHWMDDVPQEVKDTWTAEMWGKYNRRTIKGNPIVVMPDNHKWGKLEGPPNSVLVKVNGMSVEEGRQYVEKLRDLSGVPEPEGGAYPIKYIRKWQISETVVDNILAQGGVVTINKNQFKQQLIERE